MSNQLLINPFPNGVGLNTRSQEFDGTIQLAGSTVATGEPINWGDIISGIGYNEINWQTNSGYSGPVYGQAGNATALVTGLAASAGVITVTAAHNFQVGQVIRFKNLTSVFGLLLNGLSFPVATVTGNTAFTILSAITATTTSAEVGMAVSGRSATIPLVSPPPPLTATVTALSASGSVLTVTAANKFLPGALVTVSVATGTLGPLLTMSLPVLQSTGTAFTATMPSALSGTTGTGTATGVNPRQPFSVHFESVLDSGYVYQYNNTFATLFITAQTSGAAAGAPLGNLGAAVYTAGALADCIRWTAKFSKC